MVASERVTPDAAPDPSPAVPDPPPAAPDPPTPASGATAPGAVGGTLVLAPPAVVARRGTRSRRGTWSRLTDLVLRRPRSGRHRPDTPCTNWSMLAPPRRRRGRRWGTGVR